MGIIGSVKLATKSLLNRVGSVIAPAYKRAAPELPASVQPLPQAIVWNWPPMGPNQISFQQFEFCDTQPASCKAGEDFVNGGSSFSLAYRSFLQLVDPATFVPNSLLQQALASAIPPSYTPAQGAGPPGWIAVPDSGGKLSFMPEWTVGLTPAQWSSVAGVPLSWTGPAAGFLAGSDAAQVVTPATLSASVTADRVVRVPVYAGVWYSDPFVQIASTGPFLGNRLPQIVVGPAGFLRCRITEFFVAGGLSAQVTVPETASDALAAHLRTRGATVGTLPASVCRAEEMPAASGRSVRLSAPEDMPFIIGVSVVPVVGPQS
ncbi:hypothetical protein [Nitrospirillum pindoramense]|uniref:hypothetical protein n=1 Tax=Nitrospirillum amazonense TaxID=28077 RepID=UPI0011A74913|nr:hypothetical protein [Nitrospirillum amazonense]